MERSIYRNELTALKKAMAGVKNTPFTIFAKVVTLATMNMRYEKVAFNSHINKHPYLLTRGIIREALQEFRLFTDIALIESGNKSISAFKNLILEKKHEELWQEIWSRHNEKEFQEFVELKKFRLKINGLKRYIAGKDCADFGCGNGSFSFALLEFGARSVTGIDFGEKSVRYARQVARIRGIDKKAKFYVANVFDSKLPADSCDFAVSNGVFHHLRPKKIPLALKEVARVLRKGGWLWYYVDGKNAISMDLFDTSVEVLKGVDLSLIEKILKCMNVRRNKMVHLMDGMNATYIHSTYHEVTALLSKCGFNKFKRLTGGSDTDFDLDRIKSDPYGREKFGEGDLRILCQLAEK